MSSGQAAGGGGGAGWKEQLSAIGKMIVDSQTLDGDEKEMNAYQSYLKSVQYIMQTLAADITTNQARGSLPGQQVTKLYKLAKHCMERAEEMYDTAQGEGRGLACVETVAGPAVPVPSQPQVGVAQQRESESYEPRPHTPSISLPPPYTTPTSTTHQHPPTHTIAIPPSNTLPLPAPVARAHSVPSSGAALNVSPNSNTVSPLHSVGTSYMREARLRNQHMMSQYKAHLRQTSSQMLPHSQEMGLSMLRRLEENVSVARIRQQNLARKARERQQRLQLADTRASSKPSKRPQVVRLSRLSVEELREQVACFEHGKTFPILTALKQKLAEGQERLENLKNRISSGNTAAPATNTSPPSSTSSITSTDTEVYSFVNEILSNPDHPLSRLLGEFQLEVFTLLKPVHVAVEKAGGLPRLNISLQEGAEEGERDGPAMFTRTLGSTSPSPLTPPSSPPTVTLTSSHHPSVPEQTPVARDPSYLDLFYMTNENEDDDLFTLSESHSGGPPDQYWKPEGGQLECDFPSNEGGLNVNHDPPGMTGNEVEESVKEGEMDDKLAKLRSELEQEIERRESSASAGCEDGERDGGRAGESERRPPDRNSCAPSEGAAPHYSDVYVNADDLASHLHAHTDEQPPPLPSRNPIPSTDLPDGGMLSRPPPLLDEEEEEEVVFLGLPPLSCRGHYGDEEKMRALRESAEPVLAQVVPMIHASLNKLEQVFVSCYPSLSPNQQREECQSVLESLFFPALLPPLLSAYRCRHYFEEVSTARNMCQHVNATPKDLDVRRKFWLLELSSAPYRETVDELCRVIGLHSPSVKLTCLVSTSRLVVQCIDDYYEAQGQPKGAVDSGVGVDDILPILSYVIIRSGLPQLVSETALMEDFIQDGYVMGEEGFCLTSFMTALKFVSRMSS